MEEEKKSEKNYFISSLQKWEDLEGKKVEKN